MDLLRYWPMPPTPSWVPMVKHVTEVASLIGFAFLFLGLVGSSFSPRLKEIKRALVTIGIALLGACFLAGGVVAIIAFEMARRFRDGGL